MCGPVDFIRIENTKQAVVAMEKYHYSGVHQLVGKVPEQGEHVDLASGSGLCCSTLGTAWSKAEKGMFAPSDSHVPLSHCYLALTSS